MANSYHGIICASTAHLHGSECGASENFIGCKLLPIETKNGKIRIQDLARFKNEPNNPHSIQPKVVSLTQPTEYGTVYTVDTIREIARIANAVAELGCDPWDMTGGAGVDVLSFGGTKNGMMYGEAVVFFEPALAENFPYVRMQGMQLASKMRFISAQFIAMLTYDLWLKNARHANNMAQRLRSQLRTIRHIYWDFTQPTETNQVFVRIPKRVIAQLQEEYFFYV
jgi:threonine aldolase